MNTYTYTAATKDNESRAGLIEAKSVQDAQRQLLQQGCFPVTISRQGSVRSILAMELTKAHLSINETIHLMRQLGHFLTAGIELSAALSLMQKSGSSRVNDVLGRLLSQVRAGQSLCDAMESVPRHFSREACALVRASQLTGRLGPDLIDLALRMEQRQAFRGQLFTSMIYPVCIAVALMAVITVLLVVVIPTLEQTFEGAKLPWATRVLVQLSKSIRDYSWVILLSVPALFFAFVLLWKQPRSRLTMEQALVRTPILGSLLKSIQTAAFAEPLSALVAADVPLARAVQLAASGVGMLKTQCELEDTVNRLREGHSLYQCLAEVTCLDPKLPAMISVGERTGRLSELLSVAANDARRQVSLTINRLLAILTPAMTLFFGGIAGFVLFAVMNAILSINDLATGR